MDIFEMLSAKKESAKRSFKLPVPYIKMSLAQDGGLFLEEKKLELPFSFTIIFHGVQFTRFNVVKEKTDALSTIAPVLSLNDKSAYGECRDIYSKKSYFELSSILNLDEGKLKWKTILGVVYNKTVYIIEMTGAGTKAFIDALQKEGLPGTIVLDPEPGFTNWSIESFSLQKKGAVKYLSPSFKFNKLITKSDADFDFYKTESSKLIKQISAFNKLEEPVAEEDTDDAIMF